MTGKDMEQGIFYGVGTGPGEAELMTLKACRIIRECEVLVMPALGSECRAYNIVKQALPELDDKEILDCSFPMNMNKEERDAVHDQTAGRIVGFCREGKNVAFITLGDPCVYSTYTYVARLVSQQGIKTRFINGVTSFQAAAAALDIDLVLQDEMLHVIPGSADPVEALKLPGTKIFMKNKSGFEALIRELRKLEDEGRIMVCGVSHCGMEDEIIYHGAGELSSDAGYLTTIIVKEKPMPVL